MVHASRTRPACDHTSGVAARVPSPGGQHGSPVGGRPSQTCSEIMSLAPEAAAMVARYGAPSSPAVTAYSPRSPVSSGQPRPSVSNVPGSVISHCPPSRVSP